MDENVLNQFEFLENHFNFSPPDNKIDSLNKIKEISLTIRNSCLLSSIVGITKKPKFSLQKISPFITQEFLEPEKLTNTKLNFSKALQYFHRNIKLIHKDPELFSKVCTNYFAHNHDEIPIFAYVTFPSLYNFFIVDEFVESGFIFLKYVMDNSVLDDSEDSLPGLMFISFIQRFPNFLNSFFSRFFSLVQEYSSCLHSGTIFSCLQDALPFASRYLLNYHIEIIRIAARSPSFFIEYFMKRLLERELKQRLISDFNISCDIKPQIVLNEFSVYASKLMPQAKEIIARKIADMIKSDICMISLPKMKTEFGAMYVHLITSSFEHNIIARILNFSPETKQNPKIVVEVALNDLAPYTVKYFGDQIKNAKIIVDPFISNYYDSDLIEHYVTEEERKRKYDIFIQNNLMKGDDYIIKNCPDIRISISYMFMKYVHYKNVATSVDEYITNRLFSNIFINMQEIFEENLNYITHYVVYCLTDNFSYNQGFDQAVSCVFALYSSKLIIIYFIFAMTQAVQFSNEFKDLINGSDLMVDYMKVLKNNIINIDSRCNLSGIRKKTLDKIIPLMNSIDSRSIGDGIMLLASVIKKISSLMNSKTINTQSKEYIYSLASNFLYLYVKSQSKKILMVFLTYMKLSGSNTNFCTVMCNSGRDISTAFNIVYVSIMKILLVDETSILDIIRKFYRYN